MSIQGRVWIGCFRGKNPFPLVSLLPYNWSPQIISSSPKERKGIEATSRRDQIGHMLSAWSTSQPPCPISPLLSCPSPTMLLPSVDGYHAQKTSLLASILAVHCRKAPYSCFLVASASIINAQSTQSWAVTAQS